MPNILQQALQKVLKLRESPKEMVPQKTEAPKPGFDAKSYALRAQQYLNRPTFSGTPLSGEILSKAAQKTFDETGVVVPLPLALAQAQFESSMGRKGRSPATNPYNVGEFDEGTKLTFGNTQEGVNAYFDLIANDYLPNKSLDDLLDNFVNTGGYRYASDPDYENKISGQVQFIDRFLSQPGGQ